MNLKPVINNRTVREKWDCRRKHAYSFCATCLFVWPTLCLQEKNVSLNSLGSLYSESFSKYTKLRYFLDTHFYLFPKEGQEDLEAESLRTDRNKTIPNTRGLGIE